MKRGKSGKSGEDSARDRVRPTGGRADKAYSTIDDLIEPVVPAVQGQVATHGNYPRDVQESQRGFRAIFQRNSSRAAISSQYSSDLVKGIEHNQRVWLAKTLVPAVSIVFRTDFQWRLSTPYPVGTLSEKSLERMH